MQIKLKLSTGMFYVYNEHGTLIGIFCSLVRLLEYVEVVTYVKEKMD